jgi:ABC-type transport system involved in multi-copper enzyme maturation permease subunit
MGLIRAELSKLYRLRWTYAVILGMNAFTIVAFALFILLFIKSSAIGDATKLTKEMAQQAAPMLYAVYGFQKWVFSFLSFFFIAIFTGLILGREFEDGSIEFFILSPYTRFQIFLAKFCSTVLVYFIALLLNLLLQGITVLILTTAEPVFSSLVKLSVLIKIFSAGVVIDLSWIAFVFFVGMLSSGVATTVIYSLIGYFGFVTADIVFSMGEHYEFFHGWQLKLAKYTFTASSNVFDASKLPSYIFGQINELPLSFDLLGVNILYGICFLSLAALCFRYREV